MIQPLHKLDERAALVEMISRYKPLRGVRPILLQDRGCPSWNVVAHLKMKRLHLIIRCKDKDVRRSMLRPLKLPDQETSDTWVNVGIGRKMDQQAAQQSSAQRILPVNKDTRFDCAESGSSQIFQLTVRIIRLKLADGSFTCFVTSLPKTEFPTEEVSRLYCLRWTEETTFSELKCSTGLEEVPSAKPEYVQQEIRGKLTALDFVSAVRNEAAGLISPDGNRKYDLCRISGRPSESVCVFSPVPIRGMMSFSRQSPVTVTRSAKDARHGGGGHAARDHVH